MVTKGVFDVPGYHIDLACQLLDFKGSKTSIIGLIFRLNRMVVCLGCLLVKLNRKLADPV